MLRTSFLLSLLFSLFATLSHSTPLDPDFSLPFHTVRRTTGFSLDPCKVSSDCLDDRSCQRSFLVEICNGHDNCLCIPSKPRFCKKSSQCIRGEICASVQLGPGQCTSTWYVYRFRQTTEPIDSGYSLDPCLTQADCKGSRRCTNAKSDQPNAQCPNNVQCECRLKKYQSCDMSSQCEDREVCASAPDIKGTVCLSVSAVDLRDDLEEVGTQSPSAKPSSSSAPPTKPSSPPIKPSSSPSPSPSKDGTGGRPTPSDVPESSPAAVRSPSVSMMPPGPQASPSSVASSAPTMGPTPSVMMTPTVEASEEMAPLVTPMATEEETDGSLSGGEPPVETGPAQPTESEEGDTGPEASMATASESPESSAEPVCVDAEALAHLGREELVFREHAWAKVWCDKQGSCATGGHIVVYGGRAMMMESYCGVVGGCVRKEMYVNSPRYRWARRVASRTEGLEFTAFAARYQTKVEERVLVAAVHIGL